MTPLVPPPLKGAFEIVGFGLIGMLAYWVGWIGQRFETPSKPWEIDRNDKANGFPGLGGYMQNVDMRWEMEYNACRVEIDWLRKQRDFDTARQVLENARAEKRYLQDNFGLGGGPSID